MSPRTKGKMKFQPIESNHLKACAGLFVLVFNQAPWNETWSEEVALSRLQDCYGAPGFYGIAAIEEDKILGFAIGYAEPSYEVKHFYLKEMCVQSTHQRSGIGTKMLDMLCQDLANNGVGMVYLLTARDSPAAAFYEKCGFSDRTKMTMMLKTVAVQSPIESR